MSFPDNYVVLLEKNVNENRRLPDQNRKLSDQLQTLTKKITESDSPPPPSPTHKVSQFCKNATRHCYIQLMEKEDFHGFELSLPLSAEENKSVLNRLVRVIQKEYTGPDGCNFSLGDIKVSVRRYFKSLKDKKHKEDSGQTADHKTKCRRQARLHETARRLKIGLAKKSWTKEKKSRISDILCPKYLDEEVSNYEDLEDGQKLLMGFKIKKLPWVHSSVRTMMNDLMEEYLRSLPEHLKRTH